MKKLTLILSLCICVLIDAQIKDTIYINQFNTSHIVFDSPVEFIETGTGDIQVKHKIQNNILIIQSIVPEDEFLSTNLFIKTNNSLYDLILMYRENSLKSTYFEKELNSLHSTTPNLNSTKENRVINTPNKSSSTSLSNNDQVLINKIIDDKVRFRPSKDITAGMTFQFFAHYIYNDKYFIKLKIENNSMLPYTIDNYFISVQKKQKRNSTQSNRHLKVLSVFNGVNTINSDSSDYIILEMEPFTIDKSEELIIDVKEENGNRDFLVGVPYYIVNKPNNIK